LVRQILIAPTLAKMNERLKAQGVSGKEKGCSSVEHIGSEIERMLDGQRPSFKLSSLALSSKPSFNREVLRATYKIPLGRVSTYQKIAARAGSPSAARAVGSAMANNPFPLVIPCHRAIKSDLTLGQYGGGLKMKQHLLEIENVEFSNTGRVSEDSLCY
jgi:methylated-DNA-[protein]-cysteine S-methyltransferase